MMDNTNMEIFYFSAVGYLIALMIIGAVLNLKALASLKAATKIHNTKHKLLIINLIISELAIALIGIPLDLYYTTIGRDNDDMIPCSITGFIHTILGFNSLFSITAMVIVRYLSVVRLQQTWHTKTNSTYWSSIHVKCIWLLSIGFATPPFFGIGHYQKDVSRISCSPNWSESSVSGLSYNWSLIILGFFVPSVIIIISSLSVIKKVYQQNGTHKRNGRNNQELILSSISAQESSLVVKERSQQRSVGNIGSTIAIMTISFYVCWTPYAIKCILAMLQKNLTPVLSGLALLLAKLGVVINPLIYIFNNKDITGPKITKAVLDRKATKKKRKKEIESLMELRSGCVEPVQFNSV